ncbi:homeobox protein cut-like [Trichonephila clavipes]|nr:homeobox protein cut-like [Trichonephila clavipes]
MKWAAEAIKHLKELIIENCFRRTWGIHVGLKGLEKLEKAEEKDPELLHLFDEKENDQLGSEFAIKSNLEEAETKVAQLQSALDRSQSELFDLKSRYDEDSNAKSDEMEIIVNDLERANQTRRQLATCEDRHPCRGFGLSSYTIITPSVKSW